MDANFLWGWCSLLGAPIVDRRSSGAAQPIFAARSGQDQPAAVGGQLRRALFPWIAVPNRSEDREYPAGDGADVHADLERGKPRLGIVP